MIHAFQQSDYHVQLVSESENFQAQLSSIRFCYTFLFPDRSPVGVVMQWTSKAPLAIWDLDLWHLYERFPIWESINSLLWDLGSNCLLYRALLTPPSHNSANLWFPWLSLHVLLPFSCTCLGQCLHGSVGLGVLVWFYHWEVKLPRCTSIFHCLISQYLLAAYWSPADAQIEFFRSLMSTCYALLSVLQAASPVHGIWSIRSIMYPCRCICLGWECEAAPAG